MTIVKICGLKRAEDALVAVHAGADFIGLVFAPSRRQVDEAQACEIVGKVRACSSVRTVGVFVDAQPAEMNRLAVACDLDYVQLSGNGGEDVVAALDVPAIQVIHVGPEMAADALAERVAASQAELVLLDTKHVGAHGGTGTSFNWELVQSVRRPILLAGGLHPQNVAEAVRIARPWGVDVSSGVELDAEKDHGKIRQFVETAKTLVVK